jgi:trans-AT polyketide synthase/acyltransferase/oxidoreductase domain-containing protein
MTAYVFPGQGSQSVGMGKELFAEFASEVSLAKKILACDIEEICLQNPENKLNFTLYTQPALYLVNALSWMKLQKTQASGQVPKFLAGHSLGEYNALLAGGVFDFETGLKLVKKRAELIAAAPEGGMAAVIGLNEEKVKDVLAKNKLQGIDMANFNSPSQIVIAGPKKDIEKAKSLFEAAGAKLYMPLNVSGPFHSRYMEKAMSEFHQFLKNFSFKKPTLPIIANLTARPYPNDEANMKDLLARQINHCVRWSESVSYMWGQGEEEFVEVGPGAVLKGLVAKIKAEGVKLVIANADPVVTAPLIAVDKATSLPSSASSSSLQQRTIQAEDLGAKSFRERFGLKFAYMSGAMYKGIGSPEIVIKMAKAGMLGSLGTGGKSLSWSEDCLKRFQKELNGQQAFCLNILCHPTTPQVEMDQIELFMKYQARVIEASAFMQVTPALAYFRFKGAKIDAAGKVHVPNQIIAKISRPEVANSFLSPVDPKIIDNLVKQGKLSEEEAKIATKISVASDLIVEADSGGHTDAGVMSVLIPAIIRIRDENVAKYQFVEKVHVGSGGGIGSPEAALAAFCLGADFIVTGSINQATVEAGQSEAAKNLLQEMNVQDTAYCPAGDMFEIGARVQVLKRGVFFPARASKLHDIYRMYTSVDQIDAAMKKQIEEKYFQKTFEQVWSECEKYWGEHDASHLADAKKSPKAKMAMIFKWYFGLSTRLAMDGVIERKVDFQIHTGPALGAFNQWVKGTALESWKNRHVDEIGVKLMLATAEKMNNLIYHKFAV